MLDVVFVGYLLEAIQAQIQNKIKHATVVKDAQWAAVEGSLKLEDHMEQRKGIGRLQLLFLKDLKKN